MSKYCVLPGQQPVRLDSLEGHIIIIGEEPRTIPEQFVLKAKAAGCLTEEELNALKQRLISSGPASPAAPDTAPAPTITSSAPDPTPAAATPLPNLDSDKDGFAPPPAHPAPPAAGAVNSERSEQIRAAVIELVNTGNAADLTSSGAPKVEALKELCGFDVTGPERDAAYEAVKG